MSKENIANVNNLKNEQQIDRLRQAYGLSNEWGWQGVLAEKLGVKQNAVSSWKSRGVPERIISKVIIDTGADKRWVENGEGNIWGDYHVSEHQEAYIQKQVSLDVRLASQAMAALDKFLANRGMTPSPKIKRKLYEGLVEEYLDREGKVEMDDILKEMEG